VLFTTLIFALGFLPVVFAGFFLLARWHATAAAAWLFAASVFFYGYWMPEYVFLLLFSIAVNFGCGRAIVAARGGDAAQGSRKAQRWMTLGIVFNLALLGYYKYSNFFVGTLEGLAGIGLGLPQVILPIGISFFTFTQIAFLVDACTRGVSEVRPVHYGLFVTYFPHLVAGPVLHHAQMMPQFADASTYRVSAPNVAAGLAVFIIGLFKKIVVADGVSAYADTVFAAADAGRSIAPVDAWIGALAYTFQLYFDFSGYSDMAVGLSLMFNIRLPYNFDSPYKATSISDFWRRWHMTLSAFLRDYLYVPLGGNRRGEARRYLNLMATMLLGGLWHGASWTFVFWGGLHGLYLALNHGYRALVADRAAAWAGHRAYRVACWVMTFVAVVVAWVFFRAETFAGAREVLIGMSGSGPAADMSPDSGDSLLFANAGLSWSAGLLHLAVLALVAVSLPNSNRIGEALQRRLHGDTRRAPVVLGVCLVMGLLLLVVNDTREAVSPFIYFNF